jgi:hypothetical protein
MLPVHKKKGQTHSGNQDVRGTDVHQWSIHHKLFFFQDLTRIQWLLKYLSWVQIFLWWVEFEYKDTSYSLETQFKDGDIVLKTLSKNSSTTVFLFYSRSWVLCPRPWEFSLSLRERELNSRTYSTQGVWVQRILVLKLNLRTDIVVLNSTHCNRVRSCLVQGNKKSSPYVSHYTTAPSVCWENIWHYMPPWHGDNFMLPWRKLEKRFLFNTSIFVSSFDPDLSPSLDPRFMLSGESGSRNTLSADLSASQERQKGSKNTLCLTTLSGSWTPLILTPSAALSFTQCLSPLSFCS